MFRSHHPPRATHLDGLPIEKFRKETRGISDQLFNLTAVGAKARQQCRDTEPIQEHHPEHRRHRLKIVDVDRAQQ